MKLVDFNDPILYQPTNPVVDIVTEVKPLVQEMFDIMQSKHGVGLAAPQVGYSLRFFIYGGKWWDYSKVPHVVINPHIIWKSSDIRKDSEGCLSFPNRTKYDIPRPESVRVEYFELDGTVKHRLLSSYEARIFQHEYDHLDGICIFPLTKEEKPVNFSA